MRNAAPHLPQLQDVGDVPGGEDPSDVVEISHVEAPIRATGQGHGGQELVAVSKAIAAGAGDASAAPIAHDAPDDRGLLRHKLVLTIPFVQDACDEDREQNQRWSRKRLSAVAGHRVVLVLSGMQGLCLSFPDPSPKAASAPRMKP